MDRRRLTEANENLKTEISELRETAIYLDQEKEEIISENQSIKEQNRSLEAKIDCFRALTEDSYREEEALQATLVQLEGTIARLESQNQALQDANHSLRTEIQTVSGHVVDFQDYQAALEWDLSRLKQVMENIVGYFWNLKSKIEMAQRHYEEEKGQAGELTQTLAELEQIREVQENEMVSLRGQLDEASLQRSETDENAGAPSLLHEMVQAKLTQDSLAMQNTLFFFLSRLLWLLLAAVACMSLVSVSIKFYIFVSGPDSEAGNRWLLFLDRSLELLVDALSPWRARKPSGLRPY